MAERCWQNLATVSVRLAAARPNHPDHLAGAALANYRLAKLHADKPSVALGELTEAVRRQRAAVAADRSRADLAEMLGIFGPDLIDALVAKGDHRAAAKAGEELDLDLPPTWAGRPRLAGFVARCVRLARTDKALAEHARARAAKDYADLAFDLLRKAAANGFKNAPALRESPDLEVLRTDDAFRPAFEKVLADVEANCKAGPK